MDLAIGQTTVQKFCHMPAVGECLQLGRSAQIREKCAQFADITQAEERPEQCLFRGSFVLLVEYAVFFHVLMY